MQKITKLLMLVTCLAISAAAAFAEENPQPLWDPGDWDNARWANHTTIRHLSLFLHVRDARKYCPSDDRVVFLDRRSGRYFYAGQPEYRLQSRGYFVCERQAVIEGAQPSTRRSY